MQPRIRNNSLISALLLFSIGTILMTIPGLSFLLSVFEFSTPMQTQAITLIGITALSSMLFAAIGYMIWWVAKLVLSLDIRRAEIEAFAYYQVQQEYEWKTKLFRNAGKTSHPPLRKMVVVPGTKIIPFVPLKRPADSQPVERNGNA